MPPDSQVKPDQDVRPGQFKSLEDANEYIGLQRAILERSREDRRRLRAENGRLRGRLAKVAPAEGWRKVAVEDARAWKARAEKAEAENERLRWALEEACADAWTDHEAQVQHYLTLAATRLAETRRPSDETDATTEENR